MMWEDYEERSPPPLIDPIGLPTFHDLNLPDRAYRWMRLQRREFNRPALSLEFCGKRVHGGLPSWLEDEDFPYYDILHHPLRSFEDGLDSSWLEWGMKEGVAPGEPFLLQASEPFYLNCCDYGECYQEPEWYGGIVRRLRRTTESSLKSWEFFLGLIDRSRELRRVDVRAMELRHCSYDSERFPPWSSYLVSNHGGIRLASAFGSTKEESNRALLTRVVQEFPSGVLRKMLPKFFSGVILTRGERLSLLNDPLFL